MAKRKKPRTPAPPRSRPRPQGGGPSARPVQAPKVRSAKSRTAAEERRNRLILYAAGGSGLIGLAVALILILAVGTGGGKSSSAKIPDNGPPVLFNTLKGIRHTKAPWPAAPGYPQLASRLKQIGLHTLSHEALKIHIHSHLDVFVNGEAVTVPVGVGINDNQFITELHTHSAVAEGLPGAFNRPTGVIHIESGTPGPFSLGQFFAVWGVFLSKKCVGGYCAKPGTPLRVYVNGKLLSGNPVTVVLKEHEEIAAVYGKPPAHIPSSFTWTNTL